MSSETEVARKILISDLFFFSFYLFNSCCFNQSVVNHCYFNEIIGIVYTFVFPCYQPCVFPNLRYFWHDIEMFMVTAMEHGTITGRSSWFICVFCLTYSKVLKTYIIYNLNNWNKRVESTSLWLDFLELSEFI